jgi:hypothetical protein
MWQYAWERIVMRICVRVQDVDAREVDEREGRAWMK